MAGREQQVEQAIRSQGINVDGLRVQDGGQVISVWGSVGTDDEKRRVEQAVTGAAGGAKVANHVTAQRTTQQSGGDVATRGAATAGASADAGSSGGGQQYTVKSGDTLSKIAKQFYGDAGAWKRIFDVNREQISNPDKIQVGQKLYIPQ